MLRRNENRIVILEIEKHKDASQQKNGDPIHDVALGEFINSPNRNQGG